ncbi:hypothetical protein UlMin_019142 [Ulmus minor]
MKTSTKFSSICQMIVHFLLLLFLAPSNLKIVKPCLGDSPVSIRCIRTEREVLLAFKSGLTDPSNRLSSWVGEECCIWEGIGCGNHTGNVMELNLRNPYHMINGGVGDTNAYKSSCLGGKINPSLLSLEHLSFLDLSMNDFGGISIPDLFGEMLNLNYLNLSFASFSGEIPSNLGNLSRLETLDLYADSYSIIGSLELRAENLNWLSGLSSLKHLNLGFGLPVSLPFVNFTSLQVLDLSHNSFTSPIPSWLFNLTSLRKLHLRWNFFQGSIPSEIANLKSLEDLDLSSTLSLEGQLPGTFGNLSKLKILDLSANQFSGEIHEFSNSFSKSSITGLVSLDLSSNSLVGILPESLGNLKNLRHLILSGNSFSGSIPTSIGSLSSLMVLDLSYNKMNGTIPQSFGQLSKLVVVNLLMNSWEGVLTQNHLMKLNNLKSITITTEKTNSLIFNVSYEWIPPFRLHEIQLENCMVGPAFPMWLQAQSELTSVTLKTAQISDSISEQWFSRLSSQIVRLDLSRNQIKGELPPNLKFPYMNFFDLSYNLFEGPFPLWSTNVAKLVLHDNLFSGSLPETIAQIMPRLEKLYLSWNNLSGQIPSSFCNMQGLQILSLRNNKFSGELPNCWNKTFSFWGFDVTNNRLSGVIPSSLGSLPSLSVLMLANNDLHGEIPSSLQNCTGLTTIDLSKNKLTGNLPSWLREGMLSSLFMLRLESNNFDGKIPQQLCNLPRLHILDLSTNNLSGDVPKCLDNLTALVLNKSDQVFEDLIYIALKGREPDYSSTISNTNSINFSGNLLTGGIPDEITRISGLRSLNLSKNHITGGIPEKIGKLDQLETLDLSYNHLSGPIPQSFSGMASLKYLNLSYNELQGRIPPLPRFNDVSIYEGNPSLCGAPLPNNCQRI